MNQYGAVIAAGGMSKRMNQFKQLMEVGGRSFSDRVISNFQRCGISKIVVVTGFQADLVEEALTPLGVEFVRNTQYETSQMFDSAKLGLARLEGKVKRVFFTPVDIPFFLEDTVRLEMTRKEDLVYPICHNRLGVTASAGVGVAEKVCAFIMLLPSAFMQSMAAFTAQNCGAGKPKRAMQGLKDAILASLCAGAVMSYISFFHGDTLAGFFAEDQQVVLAAADYLKAYAIDCVLTPVFFCCIGFFNGFRRTKFVMIQGIFSAFCIRIPIAYFMSRQTPVSLFRIGLSTPCSSAVQIILSLVYLSHLKRKGIAGPVAETENDQADQNQNRE